MNYLTASFIALINNDPRFGDPLTGFGAVHATIGNNLHASGRTELVEKLLRYFDGANPLLAKDGSSDIVSSLLSISYLSVLSSRNSKLQNH